MTDNTTQTQANPAATSPENGAVVSESFPPRLAQSLKPEPAVDKTTEGTVQVDEKVEQKDKKVSNPLVIEDETDVVGDKTQSQEQVSDSSADAFVKTGDPGFDLSLDFATKLGLRPSDLEVKLAFDEGNFDLLEAKLAAMGDKAAGYKEHLALAKGYFEKEVQREMANIASCEKAIYGVFGGQENWDEVRDWVKGSDLKSQLPIINKMLDAGPVEAEMAALYINSKYNQAAGTVVEPKSAVHQAHSTNQADTYALSPSEYNEKLNQLIEKVGIQGIDSSPEYNKLRHRLLAYVNANRA